MSAPRVKLSIEHLRSDITRYIEADGVVEADLIATKIGEAVAEFNFEDSVAQICHSELEKFVREATAAYFRTLLTSPEARAVVIETLQQQIEESSP